MMPRKKKAVDREIEALKARRKKAQEKNDIAEEAKLCNAIGAVYTRKGSHEQALHYHRTELHLSEATGDALETAIARRRVGECLSELRDYEQAIEHTRQYLKMARELGNLVEEQRALATLGRTYLMQSECVGKEEARELRVQAGNANLRSLDICDKLSGVNSDRELLEMRLRLYLNQGLIYEDSGDIHSAKKFMEKALAIAREVEDSAMVFQCHRSLGSVYLLRENKPALALRCFRDALSVSGAQHGWYLEADVLREMSQAQLLLSNFDEAKSCLKKAVRISQENSQLAEIEADQRKLSTVRKVVHYSLEMEALGVERAEEKMRLCEKLGDLCCSLRAFPAAIKFYEQQCSLAEAHGAEPKDLSTIYVSLARTHTDCHHYDDALLYYEKDLTLRKPRPSDEYDTWLSIGKVRHSAGLEKGVVMEAFDKAYDCAKEIRDPQTSIDICRAVLRFCKRNNIGGGREWGKWEGELEGLLERHPDLPVDSSGDSDSDIDAVDVEEKCGLVTPDSLSEMETVDEEEEEEEEMEEGEEAVEMISRRRRVRKSRLSRKNEKGETLLHLGAISGNHAAARQLILEGAGVNIRDNCGWTPLHEACNHGHLDVVVCLLDSGAEVNDSGGDDCVGVTPLIDSANNGHFDIVKLLVQRGADVLQKDAKGNTAVDLVNERLASAAESSDQYELEEEHMAIRHFLVAEMRKRGWSGEEAPVIRERNQSRERSVSVSRSVEDVGGGSGGRRGGRRLQRRGSGMTDRTGKSVLISDDEDDDCDGVSFAPQSPHRWGGRSSTSGSDPLRVSSSKEPFTSKSIARQNSKTNSGSGSLVRHNSRDSANKSRQLKRPVTQHEDTPPALIPEDRVESSITTGAYPIIDRWLEDDVGCRHQTKKRKSTDPFSSSRSQSTPSQSSSGGTKGTLSLRDLRGGVGRTRSRQRVLYGSVSNVERRTCAGGELAESSRDGGDLCSDVVTFDSSPESSPHREHTFTSHTSHTLTQPPTLHLTSRGHTTQPSQPLLLPLPLRIRVRIQSKSYLVPCPAKLPDGSDSTIRWLATQAGERYYAQHGVRPRLSLATSDGALLSGDDVVAHVLQSGEEVEGQVEHWYLPPLPERYQTACATSGLECHRKVQELFQGSTSLSVLNLSHFSLLPTHLPPLLTSLRGHTLLTNLSIVGNRLNPEGLSLLASSLSRHPNLRALDLSCTGLTPQGLETLSNPSSPSSMAPRPHSTPSCKPWSSLRELSLSHNPLGGDCGPSLSALLSLTPDLRELRLQSCGLEARTMERHTGLGHTLRGLGHLTEVVVSLNPLGPRGVVSLLQCLSTEHLSILDLANTCTDLPLGPALLEDPKVLKFFTQVSSKLECLSLSHCPLEMESLLRLLGDCRHLRELRLAAVGLTPHSTTPLSRFVQRCQCLRLLDVSGNEGLGNEGCLQLLHSCSVAGRDLKMDLRSCGMTSPLPRELSGALSDLVAKTMAEIMGNRIDSTEYVSLFPTKSV